MAKIYRVIQIKLNQLVSENVHVITDLPTKRFTRCHSDRHFSEFCLQHGGKKSTGIDMEQKCVTVTVCKKVAHTRLPSVGFRR